MRRRVRTTRGHREKVAPPGPVGRPPEKSVLRHPDLGLLASRSWENNVCCFSLLYCYGIPIKWTHWITGKKKKSPFKSIVNFDPKLSICRRRKLLCLKEQDAMKRNQSKNKGSWNLQKRQKKQDVYCPVNVGTDCRFNQSGYKAANKQVCFWEKGEEF